MYRQLYFIWVYPKKGKKKWSGWRESNPRDQLGRLGLYHWATPANKKWSEQQDSNLRPPGPKPGALPNCAMPRHSLLCHYSKPGSWCQPLLLLSFTRLWAPLCNEIYYIIRRNIWQVNFYNFIKNLSLIYKKALCQMLGCSPYEPSLAPIICMVGAILFAQK